MGAFVNSLKLPEQVGVHTKLQSSFFKLETHVPCMQHVLNGIMGGFYMFSDIP